MSNCRECNIELSVLNWTNSLMKKNSKICKPCHLIKGQNWRKENRILSNSYSTSSYKKDPKIHMARTVLSRKRIRIQTLDAYGGKCLRCGIDDYEVLDIDHINNDGAADRKIGLFAYNLYRKLKKEGFPKTAHQILCKNCNWKKELERRRL